MPTGKPVKHRRKLYRKHKRQNIIRASKHQKPIPFKSLIGVSKRKHNEAFRKNNDNIKDTKRFKSERKVHKMNFGFGNEINADDPDYKEFLEDIQESSDDSDVDRNANAGVTTVERVKDIYHSDIL